MELNDRLILLDYFFVILGYREQLNELTHWIDGSAVYGSTQAQLDKLLDSTNNGKNEKNKKHNIFLNICTLKSL